MFNFTIKQLIDEVRRIAQEFPDAVYDNGDKSCCYLTGRVDNGPPEQCGCIFGQAILNLDPTQYNYLQTIDNSCFSGKTISSIIKNVESIEYDMYDLNWCETVQKQQDIGKTWSQAVEYADNNW